MLHRVITIGHWVIDFLFAPEAYDVDGVLSCLYEIGCPEDIMLRAERIMLSGRKNRGFTFSNEDRKRAVCVVGPTTSGRQFLNTLTHEVRHVADAIARSIGYELDAEVPAYISGDAAMALAEVICELGCEHCRG